VRLPSRLPSRPRGQQEGPNIIDSTDEEGADDGVLDRLFVKTLSLNQVRKNTKHMKTEESKLLTM
jgi:hypothetical protein